MLWGSVSFKGSVRVPRYLGEMTSCFSILMHHYEIFRSPCRIQTSCMPVRYAGNLVQLIDEKEILIVVASSVVHCCAIKRNVIVVSLLCDVADVQFTVE